MSLYHSPNIVRDGLALALDPANKKSYPGSGTTWSNVIGQESLSMTDISVASGIANFNGASSVATLLSSTFDFSTGQTINIVLKKGTGAHSARRNPYNQAYGGYGTITSETNGSFNYFHGTNGANGTPYDSFRTTTLVPENELIMLTLTRDTNNVAWYINGKLDATEETVYPITSSSVDTILIGNGYAGPPFLGEINNFMIYNKGLSFTEVKQNFQALRGRYGI